VGWIEDKRAKGRNRAASNASAARLAVPALGRGSWDGFTWLKPRALAAEQESRREPGVRWKLHQERIASHGTRLYGCVRGRAAGHYYVIEFPKSGGSWLADMLADYFGLERPVQPRFPVLRPVVFHAHWSYTPRLAPVAYLVRDGRDAAISAYFRLLWELRNPPYPQTRDYLSSRVPVLLRSDADDVRAHLPQFLREYAAAPVGTRLSWSDHVNEWRNRGGVSLVRYEDLVSDTAGILTKLIASVSQSDRIDAPRLARAIEQNSFQRRSGRPRGVEDRTSFLRRGVAGDWKNHCSREAGRMFDELSGETLVALGYESRRDWWRELSD
jgi:hypothetical protein